MSGILKDYDKMNIYEVVRRLNINNIKVSMQNEKSLGLIIRYRLKYCE